MNYFTSTVLAVSAVCLLACGGSETTTTEGSTTTGETGETTGETAPTGETLATTDTTTEGPTDTGGSQTQGSETAMETDPTGMPTDSDTVEPTETTDSETDTTDATSDSGTDTDDLCMYAGSDQLDVELRDLEDPPQGCPKLEFNGRLTEAGDGVWKLDNCPCGSECLLPDPWELTVDAPDIYMPEVPECLRIVYQQSQGFDLECHFNGIAIWPTEPEDAPMVWLAGGEVPDDVVDVAMQSEVEATCACEGCCADDELHSLRFEAYGEELHLQETESGELPGPQLGFVYDTINFRSHVSGECDTTERAFQWVLKLVIQA